MKLDFLIFYEHASRELESACYLASILRQRNYRVKIINRNYLWRIFFNPKVIITPYLYGDEDVHEFTGFVLNRERAIIDLQYEQIYNDARLESDFSIPTELSSQAIHICWGEKTRTRLMGYNVSPSKLPVTGAISMDFNNPCLRSFLKNKDELAKEFNLNPNKKWHLFISSFVYSSLSESAIEGIEKKIPGYGPFIEVTCNTQPIVIDWIKKMAHKHPELEFIYRPHPNEFDTPLVNSLLENTNNIHIISNYSIRQWVLACDTCSNWFSTSIADCYFAERPCCILRPIDVPARFEIKILEGSKTITSIEEYDEFLSSTSPLLCPMNPQAFSEMYLTDTSTLFGFRVADVCESVIRGEDFPFHRSWKDCFSSFKYDVLAFVFRIIPQLGSNKNSRYFDFHRMAVNTSHDRKVMKQYIMRFDDFWHNGK